MLQSMGLQRGHDLVTKQQKQPVARHMGRLRWKVPESHCHGSLNYFYGAFLPGFLRSVVLICLVLSPYFREGNGTPLQYSCLENPMDRGAWKAAVHGVAKGQARLSAFTFTFHFHALEKEMATHSSVLAWRTPGTGEPGGLPSMGSHRVGHD